MRLQIFYIVFAYLLIALAYILIAFAYILIRAIFLIAYLWIALAYLLIALAYLLIDFAYLFLFILSFLLSTPVVLGIRVHNMILQREWVNPRKQKDTGYYYVQKEKRHRIMGYGPFHLYLFLHSLLVGLPACRIHSIVSKSSRYDKR
jgi:hypothetical protein